ncbi:MAG: type II secretion system protein GspE, partial [Longimicrobiales bacterium]
MASTATVPAVNDRIGDLLVREGLITAEQLSAAARDAKQTNTRLGFALIRSGAITESDLTRTLAKQYRVPAVDLERVHIDPKVVKLVPAELALKHMVLPLRRVGRMLTLAMANPTDVGAIDSIKFVTRHDVEPVIVGEYTLKRFLEQHYQKEDDHLAVILEQIEGAEDVEVVEDEEEDVSVA